MAYRFTPADRGAFKRCRRQWDFGARGAQGLRAGPAGATRRGVARARLADPAAVASQGDGEFRRTRIPRDRAGLEAMGARPAAEALEMVDPGLRLYPSPAPEHCASCQFVAPCLAMERGGDVRAVLEAGYRDRGPERVEPGRPGAATWGTGRGAAPPRFDPPDPLP